MELKNFFEIPNDLQDTIIIANAKALFYIIRDYSDNEEFLTQKQCEYKFYEVDNTFYEKIEDSCWLMDFSLELIQKFILNRHKQLEKIIFTQSNRLFLMFLQSKENPSALVISKGLDSFLDFIFVNYSTIEDFSVCDKFLDIQYQQVIKEKFEADFREQLINDYKSRVDTFLRQLTQFLVEGTDLQQFRDKMCQLSYYIVLFALTKDEINIYEKVLINVMLPNPYKEMIQNNIFYLIQIEKKKQIRDICANYIEKQTTLIEAAQIMQYDVRGHQFITKFKFKKCLQMIQDIELQVEQILQ